MYDSQTYPELLRIVSSEWGERVCLHARSASRGMLALSYGQLEQRSRRIAAGLLALGLKRGDRVAIAAPNQSEWVELFFGAARLGVILVTLNPRYRESELKYMINQSGARVVVTAASVQGFDFEAFYPEFRPRIPSVERVFYLSASDPAQDFERLLDEPLAVEDLARHETAVRPEDPVVILYTSGTTGQPKGATITHRSMLASGRAQVCNYPGLTQDDVYMGLMPLNHVGGITCTVTAAMLTAASVVLQETFSPTAALRALDRHGATVFGGVPTMWMLMLADPALAEVDKTSLRYIIIGGSNVEPALAQQMADSFPNATLTNLYGLSESSGASVISPTTDTLEQVASSIGMPLQGVQARVVGTDGRVLEPGAEGELQLRGDCVAAGYWEMPEQTAETFLDGGWLATGDMVRQEADGHIVLLGRSKEMFLQGGYNVYPVEVENVLTAHPAVAMAAGIGVPDEVLGEVGCYHIVLRPGQQASAEALIDFCRDQLADYKVPHQIVFAEQLPMTPAGKIAKAVLKNARLGER